MKPNVYAITGLGVTEQGTLYGRTGLDLRAEAFQMALRDTGLRASDVDGYIYQQGIADNYYGAGGELVKQFGMQAAFVWSVEGGGTTVVAGISLAIAAIESGLASVVAFTYADTAKSSKTLVGAAGSPGGGASVDVDSSGAYGMYSPGADHALAAQRHMALYGTKKEHLGMIAVQERNNAQLRPDAVYHGTPLTMDDYMATRMVADPLNKWDYTMTADGGGCVIITTADRARDLKSQPVYISGIGASLAQAQVHNRVQYSQSGVPAAKAKAFGMAGLTLDDIKVAQFYDCFTITVLMAIEGYGFCGIGEGGAFIEDGNIALDGRLPINTSGGELAWSYMQGFTPLIEGVRQMRGESGATQIDAEHCLVTGHGGVTAQLGYMDYAEGTLILSRSA